MKDTSRPHPASSRSAPYRTRWSTSSPASPSRGVRRAHDPYQSQGHPTEHNSRRNEGHSRAISSAVDERRYLSRTGGTHNLNVTHPWKPSSTDGSSRERSSRASALSIYADLPGPSLRLPLANVPPVTNTFAENNAESPPPGSVTAFLRSIELPDNSTSAPPNPTSLQSIAPPSLRLPPISTDTTNKNPCANGNVYQVSLVYKGYPFIYDLSTLPDDPKGTIALLTITKSDPGAYLLVGAHYRRTGRSRAACAVIRSLLDNMNMFDGKGDAPVTASDASTGTLPSTGSSTGSPCPKSIELMAAFKGAAMRPGMLLLAACELDISREHPDDPESSEHASKAHELFRFVYGTMNDDSIVAGAVLPTPRNALGLEFSSNRNCPSLPEAASLARVKELEKELSASRAAQQTLQEKLTVSDDRLMCAEDKLRVMESRSREMHVRLDTSRDENWELRQRLAESEKRAREMAQCTPSAESRVWGRLKDLLFDNLGGGMRGE